MALIMERLGKETRENHMRMHSNPLMVAVIQGTITRDQYITELEQLYAMHLKLERLVEENKNDAAIQSCVSAEQARSPLLEADISYLTRSDGQRKPPSYTQNYQEYLERTAGHEPARLLGSLYVFEGALAGGGGLLAEQIRKKFGLQEDGVGYLGAGQQSKEAFKSFGMRMNVAITEEGMQSGVVETANRTFEHLDTIYRNIVTAS